MKQEQEPAQDDPTEVAPGVLRLQLPMGIGGLGHVNAYALVGPTGVAVVDPGLPGKDTALVLRRRLAAAGISLARVSEVVVTHSHPDHFGGAGLLAQQAGAVVVASDRFRTWWDRDTPDLMEDPATADPDPHDDGLAVDTAGHRRRSPFGRPTPWGGRTFSPPWRFRVRFAARATIERRWYAPPKVGRPVADATPVELGGRRWEALITPGHTADHLCLLDADAGLLLAGDHVLPTITPHISGLAGRDPLRDYVDSLHRVAALGDELVALPAHGHPFTGLAGRAQTIVAHHEERITRLEELLGSAPASVEELSRALFGAHGNDPLAQSETYAHLEHLRRADRAGRQRVGDALVYGPASAASDPEPSAPTGRS